jgi:drug/metabolite transporter (DMT)-like permease
MVTLPVYCARPVIPATGPEWLMCAGIVLLSLSAQLLMNHGFGYCRGWEGGVFMSSEVIFTALVGVLMLDDPVSWRFWVGGALIVGSVVMLNAASRRPVPAPPAAKGAAEANRTR